MNFKISDNFNSNITPHSIHKIQAEIELQNELYSRQKRREWFFCIFGAILGNIDRIFKFIYHLIAELIN